MKIAGNERGQFIVIAALMISILVVSIGAIMYGAVTYFRHERWEEYLAVIDAVKTNSHRMVEISLANYTLTGNQAVLKSNLEKWQRDLLETYAGLRIGLASNLTNGTQDIYGMTVQYNMSLAKDWNKQVSFSAANVTFDLNLTSIGLYGYKFITPVFLKMNIIDALYFESSNEVGVRLIVQREDLIPINDLQAANFIEFQVDGENKTFTFNHYFDIETLNAFVYELRYNSQTQPSSITTTVSALDSRGIKVEGNATLNVT